MYGHLLNYASKTYKNSFFSCSLLQTIKRSSVHRLNYPIAEILQIYSLAILFALMEEQALFEPGPNKFK